MDQNPMPTALAEALVTPQGRMSVLGLAALLLLWHPAGAAEPSSFTCRRTGPDVVTRQAELPPAARAALRQRVPYEMADAGQPWNATDSVSDPTLPFHRLICGYTEGDFYVVQYEYGGLAHGAARLVVANRSP